MQAVRELAEEADGFGGSEMLTWRFFHPANPGTQIVAFDPRFDGNDLVMVAIEFQYLWQLWIVLAQSLKGSDALPGFRRVRHELDDAKGSVRTGDSVKSQVAMSRTRRKSARNQELFSTHDDALGHFVPLSFPGEMVLRHGLILAQLNRWFWLFRVTKCQRTLSDIRLVDTCRRKAVCTPGKTQIRWNVRRNLANSGVVPGVVPVGSGNLSVLDVPFSATE